MTKSIPGYIRLATIEGWYTRAMIAKLTGDIQHVEPGIVVVDVGGVGYKVFVSTKASLVGNTSIFIHTVVRENAIDLYGFSKKSDQDFFELLLTISGIGPKSALAILDSAPVETLHEGILSGDATYLTKVSGIGKKSAEKIVVELKDKLGALESGQVVNTEGSGMAIQALIQLGYNEREAREAVQKIDKGGTTEDIVKEALKNLGQS